MNRAHVGVLGGLCAVGLVACTQPSGGGLGGYYPAVSDISPVFGDSGQGQGQVDGIGSGDSGGEAGPDGDASVPVDTAQPLDVGSPQDTGTSLDAGAPVDAGLPMDAGQPDDAGAPVDTGPDALTFPDTAGACPLDCPSGPQCAAFAKQEACNAVDDDCDGLTDEGTCDDANPCTTDACGGTSGCTHVSVGDGAFCGVGVACKGGLCVPLAGGPKVPGSGDLVISEIMANPAAVADTSGEWFEVYNASGSTLKLDGLTIADAAGSTVVKGENLLLDPGAYFVLGRQDDTTKNGGVPVSAAYSTISLNNTGAESITLSMDGKVVDTVSWTAGSGGWPAVENGASWQLIAGKLDSLSNDQPANWCVATTAFGQGDKGTPAKPTTGCK